MRSPITAMLWENWQLTRVEAAQRFGLGVVAASGAMVLLKDGLPVAFFILVFVHALFWFSISKLNGGRVVDGYKPGFPFYLLYTRPVPTSVFVAVAMLYDAVSCTALYLVSAALVGSAFRQPLPVFSMTLWLLTFHLCCTAYQWSTQNRIFQTVVSGILGLSAFFFLKANLTGPVHVEFSTTQNGLMTSIGIVAIVLTIVGVERQRRGGTAAAVPAPAAAAAGGYPEWLVNLFRFPCPTSSAARAQLWFELRSSGLPIMSIGVVLALIHALLFALGIAVPLIRPLAIVSMIFSIPVVVIFGGNAFGIRKKQGRADLRPFEATGVAGTTQMANIKVLVRTICVLAALMAIVLSVWASSSLMNMWQGPWPGDGTPQATTNMLHMRSGIADTMAGLAGYVFPAIAVVALMYLFCIVAARAVFSALQARYSCHVNIVASLLLVCGAALVILARAVVMGFVSEPLFQTLWDGAATAANAAVWVELAYCIWSALTERLFTYRYLAGAVLISAVCAAAWVIALQAFGIPFANMSAAFIRSPALLVLSAIVLTPWALSRIRHVR